MAVKKKATAKKTVAKKSTAKKVAKKAPAKKSVAKKAVAKKSSAKKAVAKKSTAKKAVAKKSAAKKATAKKVVKKSTTKKVVTKKAVAKKSAVKKSAAKKVSASSVVVPPVPTGASRDRVNVSTTPVAPQAPAKVAAPAKPSAAPRQGSSKGVLVAVLLGAVILALIVLSGQSRDSDDEASTPAPSIPAATQEATPAASEEATPAATEAPVASGEAPLNFIGNWKPGSKSVMVLTWKAPAGDVTGYKVEISYNGGEWSELAALPSSALSQEVTKISSTDYTSFRVSAIYSDGSVGVAKAFGFKGEFK